MSADRRAPAADRRGRRADRARRRARSATTRRSDCCPAPTDREQGKHRCYTEADVERIKEIVRLRDLLGLSLEQLSRAARGRDRTGRAPPRVPRDRGCRAPKRILRPRRAPHRRPARARAQPRRRARAARAGAGGQAAGTSRESSRARRASAEDPQRHRWRNHGLRTPYRHSCEHSQPSAPEPIRLAMGGLHTVAPRRPSRQSRHASDPFARPGCRALAALGAAIVGLVNIASALTPNIRWRGHLLLELEPVAGDAAVPRAGAARRRRAAARRAVPAQAPPARVAGRDRADARARAVRPAEGPRLRGDRVTWAAALALLSPAPRVQVATSRSRCARRCGGPLLGAAACSLRRRDLGAPVRRCSAS